jgi:ketosteroid isomerase-like protein
MKPFMEPAIQALTRSSIEVEQHIRQLNDEWVKAIVRADADALGRIMADDFYFTYPLESDDKAQFIADITSGDLKIKHIAREQLDVRVFGNTAVLTARDSATWLYHGRELAGQYKILSVFSERNGEWQLCAVQACPMQQTVTG